MNEIATTTASVGLGTFLGTMLALIIAFAYASWYMFKKNGKWNPPEIAPTSPESTETPIIPSPVEETPVPPKTSGITLSQLCNAMALFEGGPGDASYRNNNPLNAKFYNPSKTGTDVDYLPMYRPVKCSSAGFAIFPSREIGWLYGFNML